MADNANVGYASLQVIPTVAGISGNLTRQLGLPFQRAGQQAGQQAGEAIASGVEQAAAKVRASSDKVAKARETEIQAAAKVRIAEAQLQELRDKGVTGGSRWLRAEENLRKARANSSTATDRARRAAEDLTEAEREAAEATDDVTNAAEGGGGALGGLGNKVKDLVGNFKVAALGAAGLGAAITAGISANMETEVINDKLAASMGAGKAQASQYGKVTADIYRGAFGESMEQVSESVGVVASSFKNLQSEGEGSLQGVTTTALNFASTFGTDVAESVQTVSTLMSTGLVTDASQGFDLMTAAFQRVPAAMREELPEILHEYGVNFQALGFNGEQAFSLLVDAAGKGKFALDKTGDALKEFTIRGSDMSEASKTAYQSIGLDAEEMSRKVAAGGQGAQDALQQTARGLMNIQDPAERANAAIALFGTPLEDLSVDQIPAFLSSLTGSKNSMEGFEGAANRMGDTLNDNATAKIEAFKRSLTGGLQDALKNTASWLIDNGPLLRDLGVAAGVAAVGLGALALQQQIVAAGGVLAFFRNMVAMTKAWAAQQAILNLVMSMNPLGIVVVAVLALVAAIVIAYRNSETFRNVVQAAWNGIKTVIGIVWNWLSTTVFPAFMAVLRVLGSVVMWLWNNIISPAFTGIKFVIALAWAGIQIYFKIWMAVLKLVGSVVMWLWNNIVAPAFQAIGAVIGAVWNGVLAPIFNGFKAALQTVGDVVMWLWNNVMIPAWDAIKNAISAVWNFIRPILDNIGKGINAVGEIASKVGDAMRNAFNGVVDVLKAPIHAVGKLLASLPGSVMGIDIPGVSTIKSWGETLQSLRKGGTIAGIDANGQLYGPGTGTSDSIYGVDANGVPIVRVSAGEGVVNKRAMDNGGAAVVAALNAKNGVGSAINTKELQALATGGVIGEPYGLPNGTNTGGYGSGGNIFPEWVKKLGAEHGVKPSTYPGHQESDRNEAGYAPNPQHLNRGIDWVGSQTDMQKFAEYLLGIAPDSPGLEQIIWQNPSTGQKIGWHGRTQDDGSYFASDYPGHQDHVHLRASSAIGGPVKPAIPDTNTQVPGYTPPSDLNPDGSDPSLQTGNSGTPGTTGEKTRLKTFKELGSDLGGILFGGVEEFFGDTVPAWVWDPNKLTEGADDGSNVRTGTTGSSGTPNTSTALTGDQAAPGTTGGFAPDTPETLKAAEDSTKNKGQDPTGLKGHALYAYQIARAAKDASVGVRGATIGEATALVESGDPLKMWANSSVPESLKFPHDAVGSDHDSVGLFQQRQNGAGGTLADNMDPYRSAKLFYNALKGVSGWETMDPGAAAQAVQRSAFPDRYAEKMGRGSQLVKETGLFDTGGVWEPGTFGYNGLKEPELVVKRHQWGVMDRNAAVVEKLARAGGVGEGKLADTVNIQGYTAEEISAEWRRYQWSRNAGYGTSRNR